MNLVKKILGVLLMLILSCCAAFCGETVLQIEVFGSNALDYAAMRSARAKGLPEWNPVLGQSFEQETSVKGAATALEMLTVHELWWRGRKREATVGAVGLVAINLIAAAIDRHRIRRISR